ncbi:MAG: hypothetical protein E7300_01990 [Lachnospiraceae bacterium]|nr:hypothetical protein [Lachnospiraceae bacterium]
MHLLVSGITVAKDGKKTAYVRLEDGENFAEGRIPDCVIIRNGGFDETQLSKLTVYMHDHLDELMEQAGGVNPLKALMRESKKERPIGADGRIIIKE